MKKQIIFTIIAILFTFKSHSSLALTPADQSILNQQRILQQQQEQLRQQEINRQQIKEAERLRRTRSGVAGGSDDSNLLLNPDDLIGTGTGEEACRIYFKEFKIYGNKVISTKTLKRKVLNKYIKLHKCINKVNIESLQNELMKFYMNKGYSNTRIYFDFNSNNNQDIRQGIFSIVIEEGLVGNIVMMDERYERKIKNSKLKIKNEKPPHFIREDVKEVDRGAFIKDKQKNEEKTEEKEKQQLQSINPKPISESSYHKYRMKAQTFFAFPLLKGKVFNLKDYEHGLDQINRLQSNNATINIKASQMKNEELKMKNSNSNLKNNNATNEENNSDSNQIDMEQASIGLNSTSVEREQNEANLQDGRELIGSYSDVYITNQNSFPISINLGIDNAGNKSTGENTANISLNMDNLISINDNIYLKYIQDTNSENSKRYNKSFYSNLSVPLGYWTFNTSLSYSKYLTTVNGYVTTFTTSGNTLTNTYNFDRVMYRSQLYKFNIGSNLTIRNTESYIRNLKSITGSRKSSNIDLYMNNIIYTKLGTIIIKPSYQKGLKLFGSKKDDNHSNMKDIEPRLQYDMLKLYVYYNTRVNMPLFTKTQVIDPNTGRVVMMEDKKNNLKPSEKSKDVRENKENKEIKKEKLKIENELPADNQKNSQKKLIPLTARNKIQLNYTLTFDSQYSLNTLYGTDQFSVGGEYTVRGFRDGTISGDNGYYIKNDLRVNLQQLFPRLLLNTKPMNYGTTFNNKKKQKTYHPRLSINDALSRAYISIFYDYGYVENKHEIPNDNYNSNSGYMTGAGIALNYYGRYLNWSLTYAKALHSPEYLETRDGIKKEESSLYWRVGGRF